MTIYADEVFLLNSIINAFLFAVTDLLCLRKPDWLELIGAACLGGVIAVLELLVPTKSVQYLLTVFGFCAIICLYYGFHAATIKLGAIFLLCSVCFSGCVYGACCFFRTGLLLLSGTVYYAVSFTGLLLVAAICYLLVYFLFRFLFVHTSGEIENLTILVGATVLPIRALQDTGNTLLDPVSGQPAIIVGHQVAESLFPDDVHKTTNLHDAASLLMILKQCHPELLFCLLPYHTVSTESGLLLAVKGRLIDRHKKENPCLLAFAPTNFPKEYNALIGGKF